MHFWVGVANPRSWRRGGHWHWPYGSEMVPFERALVSSYRPSIYLYAFQRYCRFVLQHATFPHPTSIPKVSPCFTRSRWMVFAPSLDWRFATLLRTPIAIISGTGKATDCKFGRYIHRVHPNTKPIKNLGEKGASAYSGTAQFLVPLSGMDKAVHIHRIDRNKSPLKILAKAAVAPGHTQGLVTSSVS